MNNNNELVKVDCFYYSFYIKKSELSNYNIEYKELSEKTDKIINDNKNSKSMLSVKISDNLLTKINETKINKTKVNETKVNNCSNFLYKCKALEQLNLYYFAIIYYLFNYRKI